MLMCMPANFSKGIEDFYRRQCRVIIRPTRPGSAPIWINQRYREQNSWLEDSKAFESSSKAGVWAFALPATCHGQGTKDSRRTDALDSAEPSHDTFSGNSLMFLRTCFLSGVSMGLSRHKSCLMMAVRLLPVVRHVASCH